jgi:hypothetical protein
MSDSFPNSGAAIVEVIRNAVVTQACAARPCRSLPMVLIAVATIVWSSDARNMPSISPDKMVRICRWLSSPPDEAAGTPAGRVVVVVMSQAFRCLRLGGAARGPAGDPGGVDLVV